MQVVSKITVGLPGAATEVDGALCVSVVMRSVSCVAVVMRSICCFVVRRAILCVTAAARSFVCLAVKTLRGSGSLLDCGGRRVLAVLVAQLQWKWPCQWQ